MNPDWQGLVVDGPQLLESQFSKAARIAEDQGRPVLFDQPHDIAHRVVT